MVPDFHLYFYTKLFIHSGSSPLMKVARITVSDLPIKGKMKSFDIKGISQKILLQSTIKITFPLFLNGFIDLRVWNADTIAKQRRYLFEPSRQLSQRICSMLRQSAGEKVRDVVALLFNLVWSKINNFLCTYCLLNCLFATMKIGWRHLDRSKNVVTIRSIINLQLGCFDLWN